MHCKLYQAKNTSLCFLEPKIDIKHRVLQCLQPEISVPKSNPLFSVLIRNNLVLNETGILDEKPLTRLPHLAFHQWMVLWCILPIRTPGGAS